MADQISSGYVDYQRELIRLTGDLRDLRRFCEDHKLETAEMQTREVIQRIEESSFSVAVVGEFKRGKSTFINALLGSEVLPSDVLPCSATLNRVTYGMKPAVRIRFHDGEDAIIGISDLPAYVTKLSSESEQVAARVREAVVAYPTPFCERNVDIIGLSVLSGSHLELALALFGCLDERGIRGDLKVVLGGIVPGGDVTKLLEMGISRVFTPSDYQLSEVLSGLLDLLDDNN